MTVVAVLSYSQSDHHCCGVYEISVTPDRTESCGYRICPNVYYQNRPLRARKIIEGSSGLDHRRQGATPNPPKIRSLEESKRGERKTIVVAKAAKKKYNERSWVQNDYQRQQPYRRNSKEGLDHAGAVCAKPLLGLDVMLAYLSPPSPSPPFIPGFGVLERIIMGRRQRLKKSPIRTK